jgi:hypothetical protein
LFCVQSLIKNLQKKILLKKNFETIFIKIGLFDFLRQYVNTKYNHIEKQKEILLSLKKREQVQHQIERIMKIYIIDIVWNNFS